MSGLQVLTWSLVTIVAAIVGLGLVTASGRVRRRRRTRRLDALRDELRPGIVAILGDPDTRHDLPAHRGRAEDLFEVLAFDYLAKVRGDAHQSLVRVLDDRGTIDEAERRTRRPGTVGRAGAAELLGRCALARSRAPLERLLGARSPVERAVAVRALGHLGDPAAAPALLAVAGASSVPASTVCQALVRLGPAAQPAIAGHLDANVVPVRRVAVDALGLMQSVDAVPALVPLLDDADLEVAVRTARALGRIGDPRAVQPLIEVLQRNPPWPMAAVVTRALGELGSPEAVGPLAEQLDHERVAVANNAASALVGLGPIGRAALDRATRTDPPNEFALAARSRYDLTAGTT